MSNWILRMAAATARLLPAPAKRLIYRTGPLARAIRHSLNRAAPHGLTTVTVAAGGLAGFRLALDLQSEKDYWLGTYEPELQRAVEALVQPGMVVYDVGANIGYITLLFARAVGPQGKVFAFEALPSNLERLRGNLSLNGMHDRVEVVGAAVVDQSQPVRFLVGPSNGMGKVEGSAGRQEYTYLQTIEVDGLALDEFAGKSGRLPQVVKIDIEGGEVMALPGMRTLLHSSRPVILMELHGPEAAQAAWEILTQAGYRICRMADGFPPVANLDDLDWKAYLVALP